MNVFLDLDTKQINSRLPVLIKSPKQNTDSLYINIDNMPKKQAMKIFTDGSTTDNGRKNARGGIGVFFGEDDPRNISKPFKNKPTNQRCELMAIYLALKTINDDSDISKDHPVIIGTDSAYSINCVIEWRENWIKNNWRNSKKKPVQNKEILENVYAQYDQRSNVVFRHIKAHTRNDDEWSIGNQHADALARKGSDYVITV